MGMFEISSLFINPLQTKRRLLYL